MSELAAAAEHGCQDDTGDGRCAAKQCHANIPLCVSSASMAQRDAPLAMPCSISVLRL